MAGITRKAIREILRGEALRLELFMRAEAVREACDPDGEYGYVAVSSIGKNRARAAVIAASPYARNSNALHNTLINNLDAARG